MPSPRCATYEECVQGYKNVETLLILFGGVGFFASALLNVADARSRVHVLNWSAKKVDAFLAKSKEEAEGSDAWLLQTQ